MDQETQKRSAELKSEIDALESAIERIETKKTVLIVTKADKIAVPFFKDQHPRMTESYITVLNDELTRLKAELEKL